MAAKQGKAGKGRPILPQTLSALALCFTLFIFAPAEMTMVNSTNFWFTVGDFLPASILLGAAAFAGVFVAFLLLRKLPYAAWMLMQGLLLGVLLCVYVQGTYLCMTSEALISSDPVWRDMMGEMAVNTGIWGAILLGSVLFALLKPKAFMKTAAAASMLMMVMEGTALGVLAMNQGVNDDLGQYYCSDEEYFTFSGNGDVIVVMLDTFDRCLLDQALSEDPAYTALFEDFTYYQNTATAAYLTDTSFTSFMTGEVYHNQEPFFLYCRRTMRDNPFFSRMQEEGMTLHVYAAPYGVFAEDQLGVIANLRTRDSHIGDYVNFFKEMICMVGYRYMPMMMQPFLLRSFVDNFLLMQEMEWGGPGESITPNLRFVEKRQSESVVRDDSRRFFKLYVLQGGHHPLNMNRSMEAVESEQTTRYDQMLGCFEMLHGLFEDLKAQGIYDKATIIVMGDHGEVENFSDPSMIAMVDQGEAGRIGNPAMLVKYPGEKGPMRMSFAPVSLLDMRATALYGAGIGYEGIGTPAHEWEDVENRERTIVFYEYEVPFGYQFYMNDMTEYIVPQDVTDREGYVPSGRVFIKEK